MSLEKYGFIYLWYDKKRKMYYIGCHWGTENDGYVCSSNRMRDAFRRRPDDFKRRIIQKNIEKTYLLDEEYKWLQLITDDELGVKYYNLRKHKWGHWSTDENKKMSVGQKISSSPNRNANISKANKGKLISEKTKKILSDITKKQFDNVENRKKHSLKSIELWKTPEYIEKRKQALAKIIISNDVRKSRSDRMKEINRKRWHSGKKV
jgi:hypothetical protein